MRTTLAGIVLVVNLTAAGCAGGGGGGSGGNPDAAAPVNTLAHDRDVFTELLHKHAKIRREFREIDGGIESVTESDDPRVAGLIVEHIEAMKRRVEAGARLRQWDPLYVAVFDAADKIKLDIVRTGKGVRVREASTDPAVVKLIRRHAEVVSAFAANGTEESAKEHPVER